MVHSNHLLTSVFPIATAKSLKMFMNSITNTKGRIYSRSAQHPAYLPTDEQAEVLIPDQIVKEDLLGIAVADEAQAKRELAALRILDVLPPNISIAPNFYRPRQLSNHLRSGQEPSEIRFTGGAQ